MDTVLKMVENQKIKLLLAEPTLKKVKKKNQTPTQNKRCKGTFFIL